MVRHERLEPPDLRLRELIERELSKRRPAPEPQRVLQKPYALVRRSLPRRRDRRLEAPSVDLIRPHPQDVARSLCAQRLSAELFTQLGDEVVQRCRRSAGRLLSPQLVEQSIAGDDASRLQQERCKQSPLPLAAQAQRLALGNDFERAEDSELKH